jgi:glyceraldehyde 3-phosphate dehydrogenase
LKKSATVEEINAAFKQAAAGELKGIMDVTDDPIVSTDVKANTFSSVVDSAETKVLGGNMIKVLAWYDNEWGYSCRIADLVKYIAENS